MRPCSPLRQLVCPPSCWRRTHRTSGASEERDFSHPQQDGANSWRANASVNNEPADRKCQRSSSMKHQRWEFSQAINPLTHWNLPEFNDTNKASCDLVERRSASKDVLCEVMNDYVSRNLICGLFPSKTKPESPHWISTFPRLLSACLLFICIIIWCRRVKNHHTGVCFLLWGLQWTVTQLGVR